MLAVLVYLWQMMAEESIGEMSLSSVITDRFTVRSSKVTGTDDV